MCFRVFQHTGYNAVIVSVQLAGFMPLLDETLIKTAVSKGQ